MASLTIVFQRFKTKIDVLELDAALTESHELENDITEHPVEAGFVVTDHVRRKPTRVTIEGIVSNSPVMAGNVRFSGGIKVEQAGSSITVSGVGADKLDEGRVETAYATLMSLFDQAKLISIYTKLKQYDNMVIRSLKFPRDSRIGDALRFSATCEEIRIVQSKTVQVTQKRGQGKGHGGKKTPGPASAPNERKASFAFQAKQYASSKWSAKP